MLETITFRTYTRRSDICSRKKEIAKGEFIDAKSAIINSNEWKAIKTRKGKSGGADGVAIHVPIHLTNKPHTVSNGGGSA